MGGVSCPTRPPPAPPGAPPALLVESGHVHDGGEEGSAVEVGGGQDDGLIEELMDGSQQTGLGLELIGLVMERLSAYTQRYMDRYRHRYKHIYRHTHRHRYMDRNSWMARSKQDLVLNSYALSWNV